MRPGAPGAGRQRRAAGLAVGYGACVSRSTAPRRARVAAGAAPPAAWPRAAAAGGVSVLLGTAAHGASGTLPGLPGVVAAAAAVTLVAHRFATRERSLAEIAALLALGQLVCHAAFDASLW